MNRRYDIKSLFIMAVQAHFALSAQQSCKNDGECDNIFSISEVGLSICDAGFCTNPFEKGCLQAISTTSKFDMSTHSNFVKDRVCNSNDLDASMCREADSDNNNRFLFEEVRIAAGDWESSIMVTWIYQIILSEIMGVPATVEFNNSDWRNTEAGSFYDRSSRFIFSTKSYPVEYLEEAEAMKQENEGGNNVCDSNSKKPCAHMIPEMWSTLEGLFKTEEDNDHDFVYGGDVGFQGRMGFYVPRFTVERDPSLISYFGLKGEANRVKLAETFKTPMTWGYYCSEVTASNCSSTDDVAKRAPSNPEESESYFVQGNYSGHFRILEKNNCTNNPECTGHFVIPKCDWASYGEAQMYWHNISLLSNGPLDPNSGYSYTQAKEIWNAANATKSDVFMWHWTPEIWAQKFDGSHGEFQRVSLQNPTKDCVQYRQAEYKEKQRCSVNETLRMSVELSSCDYQALSVGKAITKTLMLQSKEAADLLKSPAPKFLSKVRLPSTTVDDFFSDWIELQSTISNDYASRQAACVWVYENLDYLKTQIPDGYPRTVKRRAHGTTRTAAIVFAVIATLCVLFTSSVVVSWKDTMMLKLVSVDILIWIITGGAFVVTGSFAIAIRISNSTCMLSRWITVLGYTLELLPIIIKVATINKLVREARQLRPFALNPKRLDLFFISAILAIIAYLTATTIISPVKVMSVANIDSNDSFSISIGEVCSSSPIQWNSLDYGIEGVLILSACVLVIQSRDVFEEFNEGQGLALMVYSHIIFLILRFLCNLLGSKFAGQNRLLLLEIDSILKSIDIIFAMTFYFGEKFLPLICPSDYQRPRMSSRNESGIAIRTLRVAVEANSGGDNVAILSCDIVEDSRLLGFSIPGRSNSDSSESTVSSLSK